MTRLKSPLIDGYLHKSWNAEKKLQAFSATGKSTGQTTFLPPLDWKHALQNPLSDSATSLIMMS
jgi:hypothetical protein